VIFGGAWALGGPWGVLGGAWGGAWGLLGGRARAQQLCRHVMPCRWLVVALWLQDWSLLR